MHACARLSFLTATEMRDSARTAKTVRRARSLSPVATAIRAHP